MNFKFAITGPLALLVLFSITMAGQAGEPFAGGTWLGDDSCSRHLVRLPKVHGRHATCHYPKGTKCSGPPQGPFFGYYPTCWNRWPEGWMPCPVMDWTYGGCDPCLPSYEVHNPEVHIPSATQGEIDSRIYPVPLPPPVE